MYVVFFRTQYFIFRSPELLSPSMDFTDLTNFFKQPVTNLTSNIVFSLSQLKNQDKITHISK